MIDSHCHLDSLKAASIETILQEAIKAGVDNIVTIAVEIENLDRVVEFTKTYPQVYGTQGIHPHSASTYTNEVEKKILHNCKVNSKIKAIGEIGLDYHYNFSPRPTQKEVFIRQIEIAIQLDLPIVIHSREADEDMIQILKTYAPQLKRKGVVHSFSSTRKLAEAALECDFYFGLNGIITFKSAAEIQSIVESIPLEKILLETDAPYLTPIPHRGKENHPKFLSLIAEKIAVIKKMSVEEVKAATLKNTIRFFNL